jgi:hypothetical protein
MFHKSSLSAIENMLGKRDRVRQAIASQVGRLTALLGTLQESQRVVEDALAAETVGEGTSGDVSKARKKLAAVQGDISSVGEVLAGLRRSVAKLGPELAAEHGKLSAEMPAYYATMKEDFIREYTAAAEKFSQVLGKKQAIEALIQERLDLPMPAPTAVDLADLAAPDNRLRESAEAITLAGTPPPYDLPGVPKQFHYDASKVYQLRKDFSDPSGPGMPAGSLICEATFAPGWSRFLVETGDAITANDPAVQASEDSARRLQVEQCRIESEALQRAPSPSGRVM